MKIDSTEKTSNSNEFNIWCYFKKQSDMKAACLICGKLISCRGSSTTGINRHLNAIHGVNKFTYKDKEIKLLSRSNNTLDNIFTPISKDDMLIKLITLDGIPINTIVKSETINAGLLSMGYKIPKSGNSIRKTVEEKFEGIKNKIIEDIKNLLKKGKKFSISIDEYTTINNQKILNVNLHMSSNDIWCLGLILIIGNAKAEKINLLVKEKLNEYGLNISKDIVCCVSDGAKVMIKAAKLMGVQHHICYCHTLQLAIIDTIYRNSLWDISNINLQNFEEDSENDTNNDFIEESSSNDKINLMDFDNFSINEIILKVRKIVKNFRKSPLKNDVLQKYIVCSFGKRISLILDVSTRWNSLYFMISRFLKLIGEIKKASIDLQIEFSISDIECNILKQLNTLLEILYVGMIKLSERKTDLFRASKIFSFINSKLLKEDNSLSDIIRIAILERLRQRENTSLTSLNEYLISGVGKIQNSSSVEHNNFKTSVNDIKIFALELFERLYVVNDPEIISQPLTNTDKLETNKPPILDKKINI